MSRLQRNFVLLAGSNLLTPLFSMVLVLAITRLRGVEVLGKYTLLMTVFVVGQSCVSLGLPVVVTREVARRPAEAGRFLVNACAVSLAVAGLALAAAAGLAREVSDANLRLALLLTLAALAPSVLIAHSEAVLLAFERAGDLVMVTFAEAVLRAVIGTVIVLAGGGLVGLAASLLGMRLFAVVAYAVLLRRRDVVLRGAADRALCAELARVVPVLGAIPVVNALYARADVLLLTWFATWTELGLYSAALRLVDVARTVAPAYARALYPVLARLRGESREGFAGLVRRAPREIVVLMLPAVMVLTAFAEPLMDLLYGGRVLDAGPVLRMLAWSLVPTAIAATLAQTLFAAGLQAVDLRVNLLATAFVGIVGALAIPPWGAAGAALAVLLASSLSAGLQYASVRAAVADPDLGQLAARLGAVALVGALAIMATTGRPPLAAGGLIVAAYGAAIWAAGVLRREDVERLGELVRWRAVRVREAR